ncbi:MAG: hypothetical protein Q8P70_01640 [bacterium]|nr:hypothetical protein [bacterium]
MNTLTKHFATVAVALVFLATMPTIQAENQGGTVTDDPPSTVGESMALEGNTLLPSSPHYGPERVVKTMNIVITAYASLPNQTWGNPFLTAKETYVREGIVAANFLPFDTKIRIPELFGDRIFVVEDRMHPRKGYQVDIWYADNNDAIQFGRQYATIEILEQ